MSVEVLPEANRSPAALDRPALDGPVLDCPVDGRHVYKEEIARALNLICRDSRVSPERYLQETTVPHGGE